MDFAQLAEYANHALTWIGFGTILGLIAKTILPDRNPGGTVATILMGIAGTLIGCAMLRYFYPLQIVEPISVEGFCVGSVGAFSLLLFYKVLGGYWFIESEQSSQRAQRSQRSRSRRGRRNYALDDD